MGKQGPVVTTPWSVCGQWCGQRHCGSAEGTGGWLSERQCDDTDSQRHRGRADGQAGPGGYYTVVSLWSVSDITGVLRHGWLSERQCDDTDSQRCWRLTTLQ